MEDEQDINSSSKHQKTNQKWKASAAAARKSVKTKNSKSSKNKSSLAHTKEDISESGEVMTNSHSQPLEDNHQSTVQRPLRQQKNKFIKATLKLIQMTLEERDINQPDESHEVMNLPEDAARLTDDETDDDEFLKSSEGEQRNISLTEKLAQCNQLDFFGSLDLSSLNVTDNDIPLIFDRVFRRGKKKYINLVLRDNALTSIGVKILVDQLLKTPTYLKNIGLSSNPEIGDAGIEHLIRLLKENRSITILALHYTGITDRGVRLLADFLCDINADPISSLEKLYISFNKGITDESLEALTQILEQNQTLKVLSLQHCGLSEKARRRLRHIGAKKKKRKLSLAE